MEKKQLLTSLNATEEGLSTQEAERRLNEYGPNELVEKKKAQRLKYSAEDAANEPAAVAEPKDQRTGSD